jgi:hypothetical protein
MNEILRVSSRAASPSLWRNSVLIGIVVASSLACTFNPNPPVATTGAAGSLGTAGVTGAGGTGTGSGGTGIGGTGVFPPPVHGVTSISAPAPNGTPAIPATPATKFGGPADSSRNPQLVYPNDHVLFPPNVLGIEIHWRPGSATNTLYEISFKGQTVDYVIYTRCTPLADGCLYSPPDAVWTQIAQTNRGGSNVQLTVRGTDDTGTGVGTSATFSMAFSKDPLRGGLYYWTTSGGTGIMRWDFGDTTKTIAEKFIGTQFTGGTCVGCHALSRDGTKIIASAGGQNDGRLLLFDVAKAQPMVPFPLTQHSQFESWNPIGTMFVGMYTDDRKMGPSNLLLFDGTTGVKTSEIDLGGLRADHPDWSKDGNRIAFTSVDVTGSYTDQRPGIGAIAYVDAAGAAWSAPKSLVPAVNGQNHYYPAIAPDNQTLVYDQSTCNAGENYGMECDADSDPTATVWTMSLPPAAGQPAALGLANAPGVADAGNTSLTNSFPKWAPFVFQLSEQQSLLWLTFSSIRQYGLRKPPVGAGSESALSTFIWMVGVVPGSAQASAGFSAFALPFQDFTTSNHIAQWTEQVVQVIP